VCFLDFFFPDFFGGNLVEKSLLTMLGLDVCEFGGQFLELLWLTVCYRGEDAFMLSIVS